MAEPSLEEFGHRHDDCPQQEGSGHCFSKSFLWRLQRWKAPLQIYLFTQWWPQNVIPHFWKESEIQQLSLKFECILFPLLKPPILLSVMVANIPAVFSRAANSVSYWNIVYAKAIYFLERWKADCKSRMLPSCWNVFQFRTLQYNFELLFILYWLLKYLSNNWFIKNHAWNNFQCSFICFYKIT